MAFNYQAIINSLNNFASKYGLTVYAYTPNFKGIVDAIDNLQNIQFTVEDGTIVNADVNANAAIAGTKINPNFGNQTVITTSNLGIGNSVSRGKFHVGADFAAGATDAASINLKQTSTTASTGIYLERSGEQKGYYIYLGGNKDSLTFQRNNAGTKSDVMALDRDGNVGIGTTVPSCELDIENSSSSEVRLHLNNTNSITSVLTSTGTSYSFGGVGASTTWLTTSGTKLAIGPYTAGTLQFINGGERMRIDSSGNVGIGTTSPDYHLDVNGNIALTEGQVLTWHDGSGNKAGDIYMDSSDNIVFRNTSAVSERMRIDSSGNVGIGTTDPNGNKLFVDGGNVRIDGAPSTDGILQIRGDNSTASATDAVLSFVSYLNSTSPGSNGDITVTNQGAGYGQMVFSTRRGSGANTEAMRIDSSGRVGIGNSAPSALATGRLVVGQGTSSETITIYSSSTSNGNIHFADGTSGQDRYRGYITYQHTDNYMAFGTNDIERMRILSSGGLTFNGDTATANALDDYEEGTFTPTLYGGTTAGTFTPSSFNGAIYTKIGNVVYCQINVQGTLSGAAGQPRVGGLPFTSAAGGSGPGGNATYSSGSLQYWNNSSADFMGPLNHANTTYIYFHNYDGDSSGNASVNNSSGHNLHCCVAYRVA